MSHRRGSCEEELRGEEKFTLSQEVVFSRTETCFCRQILTDFNGNIWTFLTIKTMFFLIGCKIQIFSWRLEFVATLWYLQSGVRTFSILVCAKITAYVFNNQDISTHFMATKNWYYWRDIRTFPAVFLMWHQLLFQMCLKHQNMILFPRCWDISTCVCGDRTRCFESKHDAFITWTQWVLCPNLTRTQAQRLTTSCRHFLFLF